MAHPHHCLVTQKLQSTYFNVLYAYFIIGPNVRSHALHASRPCEYSAQNGTDGDYHCHSSHRPTVDLSGR